MKILLTTLNAKYIHTNLSLKYLYGIASEMDVEVYLQEFTINNSRDYIYAEILRGGYDLLCFSCYIWNIEQIRTIAADLRKARPSMKIVLGGPEVSFDSREYMEENPWIDYIIRGEGEKPFQQFLTELLKEKPDFSKVENLTYREGEQILETPAGALIYMDKLPFPYTYLEVETDRIIYYESMRGCPFHCSYCLSANEQSVRTMSMERVKRDLGYLLFKKVRQVKFVDRTFNYDRARANEIWQFLIEKDNGVTNFHFEICADMLDGDSFRILKKARDGLFQFEAGIQSANPYTLQEIQRSGGAMKVVSAVKELVSLGNCHVHVDLIAGLPFETYPSFAQSFNIAYEAGAHNLQLGFLKLLRGTPIRRDAAVHGYVYRDKAPYEVISNDYMSAVDLVKLKMIDEVLDLFHNRGGFEGTLELLIRELGFLPFHFYERLADFYYSKGYHHTYHKKEELYRILYQFAMRFEAQCDGISMRAQQQLSFDMVQTLNPDVVKRFYKQGWEIG
ncbi:MAG: DUF4080 domain-containing protein [Eubacterium sp.]|nr:DUF4080 domain-containing protein [Eubacterium sp.]